MRGPRSIVVLLIAVIAGTACGREGGSITPHQVKDDPLVAQAREVVEDIVHGRYEKVRRSFNPLLAKELPSARLALGWSAFVSLKGRFRSQGTAEVFERRGFRIVNIDLVMEKGTGQARISFDPDGRIAGLFFLQPGVPVA